MLEINTTSARMHLSAKPSFRSQTQFSQPNPVFAVVESGAQDRSSEYISTIAQQCCCGQLEQNCSRDSLAGFSHSKCHFKAQPSLFSQACPTKASVFTYTGVLSGKLVVLRQQSEKSFARWRSLCLQEH